MADDGNNNGAIAEAKAQSSVEKKAKGPFDIIDEPLHELPGVGKENNVAIEQGPVLEGLDEVAVEKLLNDLTKDPFSLIDGGMSRVEQRVGSNGADTVKAQGLKAIFVEKMNPLVAAARAALQDFARRVTLPQPEPKYEVVTPQSQSKEQKAEKV
jgi:hypothetical protein